MGINIASDVLNDNHVCNEQKLWRHVILNAFEDVRILAGDRKSSLNKCDAHFWILTSKAFEQICWWAGCTPANENDKEERKELRRQVENKRRQIMDADNVYVHYKKLA